MCTRLLHRLLISAASMLLSARACSTIRQRAWLAAHDEQVVSFSSDIAPAANVFARQFPMAAAGACLQALTQCLTTLPSALPQKGVDSPFEPNLIEDAALLARLLSQGCFDDM